MKRPIETDKAPAAVGAYSQGVVSGDVIYLSGQLPIDPATGAMEDDVAKQAKQSLENREFDSYIWEKVRKALEWLIFFVKIIIILLHNV